MRLLLLCASAACTDYSFGSKADAAGPDDTGPFGVDTAANDTDTAQDSDSVPDGDTGDDGCYEPASGYESNPAARIFASDSATPVAVTFISSDTGYRDELTLDSPESLLLIRATLDTPGTMLSIGPYPTDSELIFGVDILDTGEHWQSGPSSRNSDGVEHVAVTYEGSCSWLIGFEDLTGGGDLDYNDVVMRVQGMLRQEL